MSLKQKNGDSHVVVVPDLSAIELVRLVEKDLQVTVLDGSFREWDYYRSFDGGPVDGRGKTYQVETWSPGKMIDAVDVRLHFREIGCAGHVGAFLQWLRMNPKNRYASIPDDRECLLGPRSCKYVPALYFDKSFNSEDFCHLTLNDMGSAWLSSWSFVAFREVAR